MIPISWLDCVWCKKSALLHTAEIRSAVSERAWFIYVLGDTSVYNKPPERRLLTSSHSPSLHSQAYWLCRWGGFTQVWPCVLMYLCRFCMQPCNKILQGQACASLGWTLPFLPNLLLLTCPISKASYESTAEAASTLANIMLKGNINREEDESQIHSWRNDLELDWQPNQKPGKAAQSGSRDV